MAEVTSDCKTYILTFQADDMTQISIIKGFFRDSPLIESAMSPIGMVFFFKCYRSVWDVKTEISFLFPNGGFIVSETGQMSVDGSLPLSAWQWFDNNNNGNENEIKLSRLKNVFTALGSS